ncbi:serglycin [Genypterus blacodes]|uniref:serglycin n=1 Tax=Genypterus blacodes TaxID=154954 RepID=UPI003F75B759
MKLVLSIVAFCLAVNSGIGAPSTAKYQFVRCNPAGGQSNCVTHQSPEMEWSPELPSKLPASATQYLDAKPVVEDEQPKREEEKSMFMSEDGSGFEGSADGGQFIADWASVTDNGSGERWTEDMYQPREVMRGYTKGLKRLVRLRAKISEAKPADEEMKEDHLLHP